MLEVLKSELTVFIFISNQDISYHKTGMNLLSSSKAIIIMTNFTHNYSSYTACGQKLLNTADLILILLERPAGKTGPWLVSGNVALGKVPTIPR